MPTGKVGFDGVCRCGVKFLLVLPAALREGLQASLVGVPISLSPTFLFFFLAWELNLLDSLETVCM